MAIDTTKVPAHILSDVRRYIIDNGLYAGPESTDEAVNSELASMTAEDMVGAWIRQNGFVGSTDSILAVLDAIRAAEYH